MTETVAPSYVGGLGMTLWVEDELAFARAEVLPAFFKPGTDRIRLGVLATLIDVVAGSPAHAIINPTVDLRVSLLDRAPTDGTIELVTYPIKSGRQLFVGETLLHTGDVDRPFARSVCTFVNTPFEVQSRTSVYPSGALGTPTYDEALQVRELAPGVLEMDNHDAVRNGPGGTVQGGAQALLAELAAENLLDHAVGPHEPVDLEIRYVNRVRSGTVRATAALLAGDAADGRWARVPITEGAADGRIVALTALRCLARA